MLNPVKRRVFGICVLLVVSWYAATASAAVQNQDSRAPTAQDIKIFLPLLCSGASAGAEDFQSHCTGLIGYPNFDPTETDNDLSLTSIIYGHITDANADQAYITYSANFEPHSNDFGGGVLFERFNSAWRLSAWYPGGRLDDCIVVTPTGQAKLLCLSSDSGGGEVDTSLSFAVVNSNPDPESNDGIEITDVLDASDDSSGEPNDNCITRASPTKPVLLAITGMRRSQTPGYFATVNIEYVAAKAATLFCARHDFASAPRLTEIVPLTWNGKMVMLANQKN